SSLVPHTYAPTEANGIAMPTSNYEAYIQTTVPTRLSAKEPTSFELATTTAIVLTPTTKDSAIEYGDALTVSCFGDDPNTIILQYKDQHNHTLDSVDHLRFLLSTVVKREAESRLRKGYDRREIRVALNRHLIELVAASSLFSMHRDQFVCPDDVYNIFSEALALQAV
ncbi:hypothetical protein A0J61_10555, partial [Choanephora cucurbitarum]